MKKKDVNYIKQKLACELELKKEKIQKRIKEIENEFDILDGMLQKWDEYVKKEDEKILPLITLKKDNSENVYFYIYFRLNNKKWTKEVKESIDFNLDFTDEDVEYISNHSEDLNIEALKYIMETDKYNKLLGLIKYEHII